MCEQHKSHPATDHIQYVAGRWVYIYWARQYNSNSTDKAWKHKHKHSSDCQKHGVRNHTETQSYLDHQVDSSLKQFINLQRNLMLLVFCLVIDIFLRSRSNWR